MSDEKIHLSLPSSNIPLFISLCVPNSEYEYDMNMKWRLLNKICIRLSNLRVFEQIYDKWVY